MQGERENFLQKDAEPSIDTYSISAQICLTAKCRHFASKNANSPRRALRAHDFSKPSAPAKKIRDGNRHPLSFCLKRDKRCLNKGKNEQKVSK